MDTVLAVVIAVPVAFFLGVLGTLFLGGDHKVVLDIAVAAVGSFGGAIAGGYAAFALEERRRQRERRDRQIAAANTALVTLTSMWNALYGYESNVVRPAIADESMPEPLWLRLRTTVGYRPQLTFNMDELVFLLRTSDSMALMDLTMQEQRYQDINNALEVRDRLLAEALERMETHGLGRDGLPTHEQIAQAVGPFTVSRLRTTTKVLITNLYRTMKDMSEFHGRFQRVLRTEFGEQDVRTFELNDFTSEIKPANLDGWVSRAMAKCEFKWSE